ncbi:MAG: glycerophosphodiester phosphodiesterase [Winogradskyella sp.]|uniref:glycerophosphodiester phosphodiesterase family protein n=1 Tax=Winogradskyella sp. TaxID=1883156 RepID=UPI0025E76DDB|nr:glycerophosphodiester phosphodiesterase family protein [Winogradskyella sp.]NRB83678.1 glycerophosphodiester phosphodiesterase [Winogradskyella sp.]
MGCHSKNEIDVQGHRGCRGLFPENSLPAFEKALDLGVHTLEIDIVISKDLKVVVSHEPYMNHIICKQPNGENISDSILKPFNLFDLNYEDIKAFDCGSKFHPSYPNQKKIKTYKPLLAEVFELAKAKNPKVRFNIEIKSKPQYYGIYTPEPETYVKLVLNEIKSSGFSSQVNLQSFDLTILEEINNQMEPMPVALLVDEDEIIAKKLKQLSFKPEIISPYYKLLTEENVMNYKSKGFQIIPWTVNEISDMESMIGLKVDGLITDYPDRLIGLLQN